MLTAKGYGRSTKGGRKHLEEITVGKMEKNDYYFAVFQGYCGVGAALYAYNNLWDNIKRTEGFYSHNEEKIKEAILRGIFKTQEDMYQLWKEDKGNLDNSGTTVSCAILRGSQLFTASVGDSAIIIGRLDPNGKPIGEQVTANRKPYDPDEKKRIEKMGGKVEPNKKKVRVIWKYDKPPSQSSFLQLDMMKSLGDLWSVIKGEGSYLISPVPQISVHNLDPSIHKYIILVTDGVSNVLNPQECVELAHKVSGGIVNLSVARAVAKKLIDASLEEWKKKRENADNLSVVTVFICAEEVAKEAH